MNKIKHITTSTYNPTSNGISERLNQTIIKILKIYKNQNIKKIINIIKKNLNETYNTSIENFPNKILKEYELNMNKNSKIIEEIKNINQNKRKNNLQIINNKRRDVIFKEGDLVFIKNHIKGKLEEKYKRPYEITKIFNNINIIEVSQPNGVFKINIKNVKLFRA
ncbi:hypothetical protein DMUE_1336 [Dictyocoela muelleri]|nr:hypothetical protein DMUE_1336 [Dictyocoela muelleri]